MHKITCDARVAIRGLWRPCDQTTRPDQTTGWIIDGRTGDLCPRHAGMVPARELVVR